MELSKHNHYVPQMLLSNWANNDQLYEYNLLVSNDRVPIWTKKNIKNIASINYLYINIQNNEELDNIEKDFNVRFETPAKEHINKILAGERLDSDGWRVMADFAAAQYVRTPAFFFWIQNLTKNLLPDEIDKITNNFNNLNLDDLKNIKREDLRVSNANMLPITVRNTGIKADETHTYVEIGFMAGKSVWLFSILQSLEDGSSLRNALESMHWSTVYAPDNIEWPTCDNPFVILNYISDEECYLSDGVSADNNIVFLPISSKIVILGSTKRRFGRRFKATDEFATVIKKAIVANAFRFIYSDFEDQEIVNMRERIVNLAEYKRLENQFENWYSNYKEMEVPILNKKY